MNDSEILRMAQFEKEYWWHKGKVYLIKTFLDQYFPGRRDLNIMEIGCGTGGVTGFLTDYGAVTGVDTSHEAIHHVSQVGLKEAVVADVNEMDIDPYEKQFDLVLALDVLEHIQDDLETMRRVGMMLKPGGLFFINVPAYKFLWSEHDEALLHKRRYHSYELTKKLENCGYRILKSSYFVTFSFPGIVLYRLWGNLFGKTAYPKTTYVPLPKYLNDFMTNILKFEANIVKRGRLPFGATLTVIAQPVTG